jgi:glycosyltransferase involved in cell wall biosynthesis
MPRGNLLNLLGRRLVPGWPRTIVSERIAVERNYRGSRRLPAIILFRWLYPSADSVIAVSAGVAQGLKQRGIPADRVAVIHNPVISEDLIMQADAGDAHPWASGPEPLLVAMGRLVSQKGYPTLLRALAKVRRTHPARLVVFGDGPDRPALEAEAQHLGIDQAVAWAGFAANPFPTLRSATLFVMPSLWEGFPNALLEAVALGLPVVATDCQWGPREMLGPDSGLLVPPGDDAALAEAIRRLLGNDQLRREYGRRALERAKAFDAERTFQQYLSVIGNGRLRQQASRRCSASTHEGGARGTT